ncbi:MAG TPA: hypothetical protein VE596_16495 [Gaiellaceae bacterium]|jgi:hypothetical protein|nr:hypothetical protein [Gaiellaceae bacterium]
MVEDGAPAYDPSRADAARRSGGMTPDGSWREGHTGLEAVREETQTHVAGELERTHREYLPLRLLGVFLVVAGLTCATLANFA